jgi:hypothetical protein
MVVSSAIYTQEKNASGRRQLALVDWVQRNMKAMQATGNDVPDFDSVRALTLEKRRAARDNVRAQLKTTEVVATGGGGDATFDFENASELGWSTGAGSALSWTRKQGSTPSTTTGPSNGFGGSGYYYFCESSSPNYGGKVFTLAYDGSACTSAGGVSSIDFAYSMYGAAMGTLEAITQEGTSVWSMTGDQGQDWLRKTVIINSASFYFKYTSGSDYTGDAAVDNVRVSCGASSA